MKIAALLILLSLATLALATPPPNDYTINVHVTSSYILNGDQGLDVLINAKKYQLGGPLKGGLITLGDYKAKLVKDEHQTPYLSTQEYELLFPDNKTRRFSVRGQSE